MHDLRKKILLESGKTVSRKARSRPESGVNSRVNSTVTSPIHSRTTSRYGSEDDDSSESEFDDNLSMSIAASEDGDEGAAGAGWIDKLHDRIAELVDRKRSSTQGRVATLNAYHHIIRYHYAADELETKLGDLVPALIKSARGGNTPEETDAALKALSLTILSIESDTIYDRVFNSLKGVCEDSEEDTVKADAIETMSIATMCGGGSFSGAEDLLELLIEIVESDGHSVNAPDNAKVVSAALEAWGFVASHLDDLQDISEQALEAFTEQLDSTDVDVQVRAGTNIALIFEASREYQEETGESWNLQYDQHKLLQRMTALTRESSKSISKSDRKRLHASFNDILTSIERGKGPGYSTAQRDPADGYKADVDGEPREYGYRNKIRIHNIRMIVDSWTLSARVEMLKSILGGGFAAHYMQNPAVKDLLSSAQVEFVSGSSKKGQDDSPPKKGRGAKAARSVPGL